MIPCFRKRKKKERRKGGRKYTDEEEGMKRGKAGDWRMCSKKRGGAW